MDTQFVDLPLTDFPFTVQFLDVESGKVVWEQRVEGPGALLVPGKANANKGRPVRIILTFPDGEVREF